MVKKIVCMYIPVFIFAASVDDYVITVKTDNAGASNSNEFTIPIVTTNGDGYNVDCDSDGIDEVTGATTEDYPDGYTCVYPSSGTYTIRVKDNNGDNKGFRRIRFYIDSTTTTDVLKLIEINQWGSTVWSSMVQAYRGASNLTTTPTDIPNFSATTSLSQMFYGCTNADITTTGWDIHTMTNLSEMFRNTTNANPDVSTWDTSSVTNMTSMFKDAVKADPDVSGWDTSQVTYMDSMFYNAEIANPDVSKWDTSSVTNMASMFRDAVKADPDVSGWDTSQVTRMDSMFYNAEIANPDVSKWNTSSVTNMASMFRDAVKADPDVSGWDTSQVTRMDSMFYNAEITNPDVSKWDTSSVTNMASMFRDAVKADPDVTNWNVGNVTNMSSMFRNAVSFDRNLRNWNVSHVTDFTYFLTGGKLSTYNYDALLKGWTNLTLSDGERFDAGDSTYCSGEEARTDMIANYNWDIRDAGKYCPAPCEEVNRPLSAMHWTMISFPCDTGNNGIEALLGNALGSYGDNGNWVVYEQTGADDYIGGNTQKRMLSATDTVVPGKGYWIITASDANMTVDTTLSGLNFTSVQAASNLGISSSVFDDLNRTQLPDSDNANKKKVALGNPFPQKMQLSDLYFSHSGGTYHPMGDSSNDTYIQSTVYTYDHTGTDITQYIAIVPETPGFDDRIDPMTGFFIILKSGQTGSNTITFPYEK